MAAHAVQEIRENDAGFTIADCICGWTQGGLPDQETGIDALMQHAREQGFLEAQATNGR